jgi:hypothetical protein
MNRPTGTRIADGQASPFQRQMTVVASHGPIDLVDPRGDTFNMAPSYINEIPSSGDGQL